eukprot:418386_1
MDLRATIEREEIVSTTSSDSLGELAYGWLSLKRYSCASLTLFSILSCILGCLVVLQSAINIELSSVVGSDVLSALISFSVGFLALVPMCVPGTGWRVIVHSYRELQPPWWLFAGGLFGALFVFSTIMISPVIGFSLMFTANICGTLVGALLCDHFGFLGFTVHKMSRWKALGALLTISGVVFQIDFSAMVGTKEILFILLSFVSGTLLPAQSVFTAKLTDVFHSSYRASAVSFLVGIVALGIASIVDTSLNGVGWDEAIFWKFLGGFIGAAFVVSSVIIPPIIGFATFFVLFIFGQLAASAVADQIGLMGLDRREITPFIATGVAISFVGSVLVHVSQGQEEGKKVPDIPGLDTRLIEKPPFV